MRFHLHDIVEIDNGTIVVAKLHSEQSAVIMGKKIVGIKVKGRIIVGHCSSQVVDVESCQRTVYIVVHRLGLKVYCLSEERVGIFPLAFGKSDHGSCCPCRAVIRVYLQTLVEPSSCLCRVFLHEVDLSFERIGIGIFLPFHDHGVELLLSQLILLAFNVTQRAVEPCSFVLRIKADELCIVGYGVVIVVLPYAAQTS